ncbi:unnamed protein product, partial [Auanema sp. JU1783]
MPKFQQPLAVERRSVNELDEKNLNAKANYIASKFDAEENFKNNITRRIAQDHLQYATGVFQEDLRKHFQDSYENICEIQNKYLELWHSILHIEPTIAMRTILGRDDIAARFVGKHVVHIHVCTEIAAATVFYNHALNGTCYLETPLLTKTGELWFASPGSKDVFATGKEISCDQVPTDIWHDKDQWIGINGSVESTPMHLIEAAHHSKVTPLKFTGVNLYTNLTSRTTAMSAAIAYGVSLASIRQNHALHAIHNNPVVDSSFSLLKRGSDYLIST